jgi:hypothetical protein
MVTAGVVIVVLFPDTPQMSPNPYTVSSQADAQEAANGADEQPEQARLSAEIIDALRAKEWPVLSPSLDDVVSGSEEGAINDCMGEMHNTIRDCTRGNLEAPHTIVLVGDSTSMSYEPAFESIVEASDGKWRMELRNFIGCSFMAGYFRLDFKNDAKEKACPSNVESTISAIEAERPDIVVVTNGYWPHEYVSSGRAQDLKEREESIRSVLLRISQSAGKIILMPPPAFSVDTRECYSKISTPEDCVGSKPRLVDFERVDRRAAEGIDNALFINTWSWFCSQDGRCPAFVGTLPVRFDNFHLTGAFSRRLGPVVQEAFSAVGVTF